MYASCLGYICRKRLAVLSVIPIHLRRFGLFSSISWAFWTSDFRPILHTPRARRFSTMQGILPSIPTTNRFSTVCVWVVASVSLWAIEYESLQVPPIAITQTCIFLAWSFSFPGKKLDESLEFCCSVCQKDKETVVSIVRELFPMMCDTCDVVLARHGEKAQYCGISPISVATWRKGL